MYKEKDFQNEFRKFCPYCFKGNAVFELKITHTGSIPFAALKEHQKNALMLAKYNTIFYKIPDLGQQNPWDAFQLSHVSAFVCVMFYKPRKQKTFFAIPIEDWIEEEKKSERKSLTFDRAKEIFTEIELSK